MLNDEDRKELHELVVVKVQEGLRAEWKERRERKEDQQKALVLKTYLVTVQGHIGFPDELGRAIMSQAFYARIKVNAENPAFYAGSVEVVAWGDGKVLKAPFTVVLTGSGVMAMVEVGETFLERSHGAGGGSLAA